jgi:hypothetical protein
MEPDNPSRTPLRAVPSNMDDKLKSIANAIAEQCKRAVIEAATPTAMRKRVIELALAKLGDVDLTAEAMASIANEQFKLLGVELGLQSFSKDTIKRDIAQLRPEGRAQSKGARKGSRGPKKPALNNGNEKKSIPSAASAGDPRIASQDDMFGVA